MSFGINNFMSLECLIEFQSKLDSDRIILALWDEEIKLQVEVVPLCSVVGSAHLEFSRKISMAELIVGRGMDIGICNVGGYAPICQ